MSRVNLDARASYVQSVLARSNCTRRLLSKANVAFLIRRNKSIDRKAIIRGVDVLVDRKFLERDGHR